VAVWRGRREEFKDFPGFGGDVADPQAEESFEQSRLNWQERSDQPHAAVERLYRDALARRRDIRREQPFRAESPIDGGLVLRYGRFELLIALRGRIELPTARAEQSWLWHTELPELTSDTPVPPRPEQGGVWFERPGALLTEQA
jgi:maltooligosyltrehalose trehalohydrolase